MFLKALVTSACAAISVGCSSTGTLADVWDEAEKGYEPQPHNGTLELDDGTPDVQNAGRESTLPERRQSDTLYQLDAGRAHEESLESVLTLGARRENDTLPDRDAGAPLPTPSLGEPNLGSRRRVSLPPLPDCDNAALSPGEPLFGGDAGGSHEDDHSVTELVVHQPTSGDDVELTQAVRRQVSTDRRELSADSRRNSAGLTSPFDSRAFFDAFQKTGVMKLSRDGVVQSALGNAVTQLFGPDRLPYKNKGIGEMLPPADTAAIRAFILERRIGSKIFVQRDESIFALGIVPPRDDEAELLRCEQSIKISVEELPMDPSVIDRYPTIGIVQFTGGPEWAVTTAVGRATAQLFPEKHAPFVHKRLTQLLGPDDARAVAKLMESTGHDTELLFRRGESVLALRTFRANATRLYIEDLSKALTDPLTTLLERRGFAGFASQRRTEPGRFCFLDLDNFSWFNDDTMGGNHKSVGDVALKIFAAELRAATAGTPTLIGRWGGDEFMIFENRASAAQTPSLEDRLTSRLSVVNSSREYTLPWPLAFTMACIDLDSSGLDWDKSAELASKRVKELKKEKKEREAAAAAPVHGKAPAKAAPSVWKRDVAPPKPQNVMAEADGGPRLSEG